MCTKIDREHFTTIHHEMGHIQYFMSYRYQPAIFRTGANPGFHEAIGDTIALSVSTSRHFQKIGLLKPSKSDSKSKSVKCRIKHALKIETFKYFRSLYLALIPPIGLTLLSWDKAFLSIDGMNRKD